MANQTPTHWPNLPVEIRDKVLECVVRNKLFVHSNESSGGPPSVWKAASVLALIHASKQFAGYQDVVNAILRSGRITIRDVADITRVAASLTLEQQHILKTLSINQNFLDGIGSTSGAMTTVPDSIGNFRLDMSTMLQVYISVSKDSSIARTAKRKRGEQISYVDWEDDIQNGFVSVVEAESMLLDACVKNFDTHSKDYTGLGALLSYAATHGVGLQTKISVTFVERQSKMILAKVDDARLSTKGWNIRLPLAGQELSIKQTLSKDCFAAGLKDVGMLLGHVMPGRRWSLLTLQPGDKEEYQWVYWYQTSTMAPGMWWERN